MDTTLLLIPGALLLSIVVGYILISFVGEEESEDTKITQKRLLKIKNKEYDLPATKVSGEGNKTLMQAIISDEGYKFALFGRFFERFNFVIKLKQQLKLADLKTDISQFMVMVLFIFVIGTLFALITPLRPVAALFGLAVAFGLPFLMIKLRIAKKLTTFTAQLPDALGLISSSLRAGHSLTSAFAIVVHELPDPIASLFKTVCEDINLGRDTKEALDNMIENMPGSLDLRFFVTAVLIQKEIGGNLAEILDSLNDTIRERFKLLGQLKAQTAQASLSGIVLALAPVFIGGVIWLLNPTYMEPLFNSSLGKGAIMLAVFLGVLGYAVIKKITNIRV